MDPRDHFESLAAYLETRLRSGETSLLKLDSEASDFVRINRAKIRQAGSVLQHHLVLSLIEGRREISGSITLSGESAIDRGQLEALLGELRAQLPVVPEDPHLLYETEPRQSERVDSAELPSGESSAAVISDAAGERDLVGIFASGDIWAGFASSLGQRAWFANRSFHLDYSFHQGPDRAIKGSWAGTHFDPSDLSARFARADAELAALSRPMRELVPGRYRVYLSPAAMFDVMDLLCWGGFGLRAHRTRTTPLLRLAAGELALDERVQILENARDGIAPDFQSQGFRRPDVVPLVEAGRYRECLVSPRSAVEYGATPNGASSSESPESLDVAPGTLAADDVLAELGTGLYIGNLWYLNYSDRPACRTTGMTRFATFWVENGQIVAPAKPMRFDESLYRMLGEHLVHLGAEAEMMLDSNTYGARKTRSVRLPGALIDAFNFAL